MCSPGCYRQHQPCKPLPIIPVAHSVLCQAGKGHRWFGFSGMGANCVEKRLREKVRSCANFLLSFQQVTTNAHADSSGGQISSVHGAKPKKPAGLCPPCSFWLPELSSL